MRAINQGVLITAFFIFATIILAIPNNFKVLINNSIITKKLTVCQINC